MSLEVLEALGRITREKSIGREELIEMVEAGILAAARKRYGTAENIRVEMNPEKGSISVIIEKTVVDEVEDPAVEVTPEEARNFDPEAEVGGTIEIPIEFSEFGRTAIQAAKQVVIQRVREAEREKVHEEYSGRIGEIIYGTVQSVERGSYIVYISKQTEAIIPSREQNRKERFKQGDPIMACLIEVNDTTKGPQLILSRTHAYFLRSLFVKEVPEIAQGLVEIKEIAREPGSRSKVAVVSHDRSVDPVGACVGLKGSRVQSIVKEVGGERIDIVPWSDDADEFVRRSLSPAMIVKTFPDYETHTMAVIVAEDQLSLAIGRSGQNVRLASRLTGWQIDLMTREQFEVARAGPAEEKVMVDISEYDLTHIPGIGGKTAEKLKEAGYASLGDLIDVDEAALLKVDGIGGKTAKKLIAIAEGIASDMLGPADADEEPVGEEGPLTEARLFPETAPVEEPADAGDEAAEEPADESGEAVEEPADASEEDVEEPADESGEAAEEPADESGEAAEEPADAGGEAAEEPADESAEIGEGSEGASDPPGEPRDDGEAEDVPVEETDGESSKDLPGVEG